MSESLTGLSAWESFYVIVGSSGGALIGLQFVVITLLAERPRRGLSGGLGAFGTPTVVHLTGALSVSAIMSAPWHSSAVLSVGLGVSGLAGLIYGAIVVRRARRQKTYEPVGEDWLWYTVAPCVCYAGLVSGAVLLRSNAEVALSVVGGAALGLLLIGIRNAWDSVTHVVVSESDKN